MSAAFVNAHTHIYSGLAPLGMPLPARPPASFVEILERVWWRLDRAIDAPSLAAAARFYAADALLHGTSVLVDHHESPHFIDGSLDVVADACEALGIAAVLCYGATERNGGRDEARRGLAECRRFIASNRRRLIRGVVGLHASFTVSDDTIREAADLCRELGSVLHVHVAEDRADVEDARRRGHAGPLERLIALDALPRGSILAHGVHLSEPEVRSVRDRGCWIVQNPRSNRTNRVGYPRALGASDRVALGTDGFPSDMRAERAALEAEAADHGEPQAMIAVRADAGARLAAERFGADEVIGDGDFDSPGLNESSGGKIQTLSIAGRTIVRDGVLLTGDIDAIRAEARAAAAGLWGRMQAF